MKFLIYKKLENGYGEKLGSYEADQKDDSSANRSWLLAEPMASHFELPEGLSEDVVRPAWVEAIEGQEGAEPIQARWYKDGEQDRFEQPTIEVEGQAVNDDSWSYYAGSAGQPAIEAIPAHWALQADPELVAQKAQKQKEDQVKAAYDQMNADVYAQMAQVFGTTNPESATANEKTWQLMQSNSAAFVSVGIKDDQGVEFTSAEQVEAYAQAKVASVLAYGIWRLQRIEQFRQQRDQILNS